VDAVHDLVARGTPFRTAYRMVASEIEANTYTPPREIAHTHIGSIGNPGNERIRERLRRECAAFPFARRDAAFAALLMEDEG
jgi:argininosuccinate lyase